MLASVSEKSNQDRCVLGDSEKETGVAHQCLFLSAYILEATIEDNRIGIFFHKTLKIPKTLVNKTAANYRISPLFSIPVCVSLRARAISGAMRNRLASKRESARAPTQCQLSIGVQP